MTRNYKLAVVTILTAVCFQLAMGQWWSLAAVPHTDVANPNGTLKAFPCDKYRSSFTSDQYLLCKVNSYIVSAMITGMRRAIKFCQQQFKDSCWNCTIYIGRYLLGQDIEASANKEREYVRTLLAAAITYDLADLCRKGQIPDCPSCVLDGPYIQKIDGGIRLNSCGVDVKWAGEMTRQIMGYNASNSMIQHNIDLGISMTSQTVEKCTRLPIFTSNRIVNCHKGIENILDCRNTTKLSEGWEIYNSGIRGNPTNSQQFHYLVNSVNYCCALNTQTISRWTSWRECVPNGHPDCTILCCGRGYRQISQPISICGVVPVNGVPKEVCTRGSKNIYICN